MNCIKSLRIRSALKSLERAKLNAYRKSIGLEPVQGFSAGNCFKRCCKCFGRRVLCCCLQWKVSGTQTVALDYLLTNGTLPNRVLKALIGIIVGVLTTYLLTPVLRDVLLLSRPLLLSTLIGCSVSLGLAFSSSFRLLALLVAPQIFTNQARIVLLGYALGLAMSGPGTNYVKNLEILTNSIHACMDMLNDSFKDIVDLARNPMSAISAFFKTLKSDIMKIFQEFKNTFGYLKSAISSVVEAIKSAYNWLESVTEMCNMDFGTPYDRCKIEFQEAATDCAEQLGETLSFMCHVDALDDLCEVTKAVDILCLLPSLIKQNVFKPIEAELDKILETIKEFFDARIHATYDLDMDLNASKSASQVLGELKADILIEMEWLLWCFSSINGIAALAFFAITIGSALYYRYWYLNSDHHDNKYITRGMVKLDLERVQLGRDGIFPLKFNESQEYVQVWSLRMLKEEKRKFKRNFLLVLLSAIPILTYICLDAGLYQLLALIQKHGAIKIDIKETIGVVNISGDGFMADVDRIILKALQHLEKALPAMDTEKCLPVPLKPNYGQYIFIGAILFLCVVLVFTEAYGLRFRQYICSVYHPDRQIHRDKWLYIHILSSRGSFFKYAKDQIAARLMANEGGFRVGLVQRILHTCPGARNLFWFLEVEPQRQCMLCGKSGDWDDEDEFYMCPTCDTAYCIDCFRQVEQRCPVCHRSMEEDSIDEETGSESDSEEGDYEANDKIPLVKGTENKFSMEKHEMSQRLSGANSLSPADYPADTDIGGIDQKVSASDDSEEPLAQEGSVDVDDQSQEESILEEHSPKELDSEDGKQQYGDHLRQESPQLAPYHDSTDEVESPLHEIQNGMENSQSVSMEITTENSFTDGPIISVASETWKLAHSSMPNSTTRSSTPLPFNSNMESQVGRRKLLANKNRYSIAKAASDKRQRTSSVEFETYENKAEKANARAKFNAASDNQQETQGVSSSDTIQHGKCHCLHYGGLSRTFFNSYDQVLHEMVQDYPEFDICKHSPSEEFDIQATSAANTDGGTISDTPSPSPSSSTRLGSNTLYYERPTKRPWKE